MTRRISSTRQTLGWGGGRVSLFCFCCLVSCLLSGLFLFLFVFRLLCLLFDRGMRGRLGRGVVGVRERGWRLQETEGEDAHYDELLAAGQLQRGDNWDGKDEDHQVRYDDYSVGERTMG